MLNCGKFYIRAKLARRLVSSQLRSFLYRIFHNFSIFPPFLTLRVGLGACLTKFWRCSDLVNIMEQLETSSELRQGSRPKIRSHNFVAQFQEFCVAPS